jgi:hypothetical protein
MRRGQIRRIDEDRADQERIDEERRDQERTDQERTDQVRADQERTDQRWTGGRIDASSCRGSGRRITRHIWDSGQDEKNQLWKGTWAKRVWAEIRAGW